VVVEVTLSSGGKAQEVKIVADKGDAALHGAHLAPLHGHSPV